MSAQRLVFMGSPTFAVPVLQAILEAGHRVVCVYSQPPRRGGRDMAERKTPVHLFAERRGVEVRTPRSLKDPATRRSFGALATDAAVVAAYGLMLPEDVLAAPRHGCFNVHASILPRWRGAAPIHRAIMAGDEETGVGVMRMEKGLDAGPVCLERRMPIAKNMTAGELHDALADMGARAMVEALAKLAAGELSCLPQAIEGATYAAKIDKGETKIDFRKPARVVHDHIRGLSPFPGAWFELPGKRPARIKAIRSEPASGRGAPGTMIGEDLTFACGDGAVRLTRVQRAGKDAMSAAEFLRGTPISVGMRVR